MKLGTGDNDDLHRDIRTLLDERCDRLPSEVGERLRASRRMAISRAERHPFLLRYFHWVTAGRLATAAVLVVAVSIWFAELNTASPGQGIEELEVAAAVEQAELLDDLDFYLWLAERGHAR